EAPPRPALLCLAGLPSGGASWHWGVMTSPKAPASKAPGKPDRPFPTLLLELEARATWDGHVCGVDEAGRGPWAGPVSAAAVILNPDDLPPGIDDSKALTEKRRTVLEIDIKARALAWGVGFASVEEIDELNILHATGLAMRRAVEALAHPPVHALVDGNYRFPLPCAVTPVVKGDTRSLSIAAASILATTAPARLRVELAETYPGHCSACLTG